MGDEATLRTRRRCLSFSTWFEAKSFQTPRRFLALKALACIGSSLWNNLTAFQRMRFKWYGMLTTSTPLGWRHWDRDGGRTTNIVRMQFSAIDSAPKWRSRSKNCCESYIIYLQLYFYVCWSTERKMALRRWIFCDVVSHIKICRSRNQPRSSGKSNFCWWTVDFRG